MIKALSLIALLSGCTTTSAQMVIDGTCTVNERAELSGMRTGAMIVTPDPNTENGRIALDRMAALEAECK